MNTVSDKVARHSLAFYPCINDWWVVSFTWKFGGYWPTPCKSTIFNLH